MAVRSAEGSPELCSGDVQSLAQGGLPIGADRSRWEDAGWRQTRPEVGVGSAGRCVGCRKQTCVDGCSASSLEKVLEPRTQEQRQVGRHAPCRCQRCGRYDFG